MFKVHGYLDNKLVMNCSTPHIPSVGDTVRFNATSYGTVTEVIWCLDEPDGYGQRVNLRIVSLKA